MHTRYKLVYVRYKITPLAPDHICEKMTEISLALYHSAELLEQS